VARLRTPRDVGALVRATREAQGLTQAVLAERAGVSRRWLIATESGEHPRAELDRVLRVLDALGLRVSAMAGEDAPVSPEPEAPASFDLAAHLASFRTGG